MPLTKKEKDFEVHWDRMEKLAKSGGKAERKLSRKLARRLVSFTGLPRSYGIRAHMALASLACAQDSRHEAEENHMKIHAKVPSKLQAELQIIREAYKSKKTEDLIVIEGDEAAEDASGSTLTTTAQLRSGSHEEPIDLTIEHGSQQEPIDLTFEHDPTLFENTSGESHVDPASDHVKETGFRSTGFSFWPRSKVICFSYILEWGFTNGNLSTLLRAPTHSVSRPNNESRIIIINEVDLCDGNQNGECYDMLRHSVQKASTMLPSRTIISSDTGAGDL